MGGFADDDGDLARASHVIHGAARDDGAQLLALPLRVIPLGRVAARQLQNLGLRKIGLASQQLPLVVDDAEKHLVMLGRHEQAQCRWRHTGMNIAVFPDQAVGQILGR